MKVPRKAVTQAERILWEIGQTIDGVNRAIDAEELNWLNQDTQRVVADLRGLAERLKMAADELADIADEAEGLEATLRLEAGQ